MNTIFFDFDGVVADTVKFHVESWVQAFRTHGFSLDTKDVYMNEGSPFASIIRTLFRSCKAQYEDVLAEKIIETKDLIFKGYDHSDRIYPHFNGIMSVLDDLGFKKGLVTGAPKSNLMKTIPEALFNRFDVVVTADDVARGKPFPDPYLKAAEILKVKPSDCLVVENAPLGIKAAKESGMTCLAICTTLAPKYLSHADIIIKDHQELTEKLIAIRDFYRPLKTLQS